MAALKLSVTEYDWLMHAQEQGPEGFVVHRLINTLCRLAKLGYLERDAHDPMRWRITSIGSAACRN
jgi:hypothetical protein